MDKKLLFFYIVIQIVSVLLYLRFKLKRVLAQLPTPKHASKYPRNQIDYLYPTLADNHYSARLGLVLLDFQFSSLSPFSPPLSCFFTCDIITHDIIILKTI